jgi:hypothetical protein
MMVNSILFIRIQHKMSEIDSRQNSENQSFSLQQRSSKNDNQSEELPQPPMIDRAENPTLRFPSRNTNPRNIVEISNVGLTFLYDSNKYPSSYNWDGLNPSLHGPPTIIPLCLCPCDFCNNTDQGMTMQGSIIYGVLFVCPECQHGLTTRLKEILGESLLRWFDTKQPQPLIVPRKNGTNKLWIFCSRLPEIYLGEWHVRVQSRSSEELVPLSMLKELNKAVPA